MEFLNSQDIKVNMLHDRALTIARCNKGEGSLRLSVDEKGVNFEFEAPKCDIGDRCLEMVKRGDYSGCSFEFWPGEYDKIVDGNDVTIIHNRFEFLSALTIGMDPAYRLTTVNVRELEETKRENEPDAEEEERKRKEAEEKAVREYRERLRRIQLNESIDELDY